MKIVVINETSAADTNTAILSALEGRGHEVINAGMTQPGVKPELTYIHTGLLSGLLLNAGRADLVIGGCGTGQGFLNSCMQYPGVFCGLVQDPLDAWLFRQINGGNCISLALKKGYGWAADINLRFLFDRFFSVESGAGYPPHRRESQRDSLQRLQAISKTTHCAFSEIIQKMDRAILQPVLEFPGVQDLLDLETLEDTSLKIAIRDTL